MFFRVTVLGFNLGFLLIFFKINYNLILIRYRISLVYKFSYEVRKIDELYCVDYVSIRVYFNIFVSFGFFFNVT